MRTQKEVVELIGANYKTLEETLKIKIRNGQTVEGIRKALLWVNSI